MLFETDRASEKVLEAVNWQSLHQDIDMRIFLIVDYAILRIVCLHVVVEVVKPRSNHKDEGS